jgi:virginiamycin B lyase
MSGRAVYRGLRDSLFCGLFIMIGFSPLRAQITEYPVPFNGLSGIAAGPDGAMWFSGNGYIGEIMVNGLDWNVASYSTPTLNAGSAAITTGPDGALWFIESGNGKIGRITTSGTITEIPLPASEVNSGVYGITAGPDGNLWFTEDHGANKIVRMTTSGVFTIYTVASPVNVGSLGITAGPDGALWFADQAGKIGRITTSGAITEYTLPEANDRPNAIASGPDGAATSPPDLMAPCGLPNWAARSDVF